MNGAEEKHRFSRCRHVVEGLEMGSEVNQGKKHVKLEAKLFLQGVEYWAVCASGPYLDGQNLF